MMERQYLVTERAHFMCPNMHFGMLVELAAEYDGNKIKETLEKMEKAHPFLRSVISYDEDGVRLYYDVKDESKISFVEKESMDTMWEDYKAVSKYEWNPFVNGLLKVYAYNKNGQTTLLFIAHHLLGDGRCILEIAKEFAECYVQNGEPEYVEEALIRTIDDLPEKSDLTGISKLLVKQANKQWRTEGKRVRYEEYALFVEKFASTHPVCLKEHYISDEEFNKMIQLCKENGITLNDLLMAHMYIKTGTEKIIIAADLREKLACYRKGACGNYASAMGIVCKSKTTDVVKKAKEVHRIVRKQMSNNRKLMLVLACYFNMEPTLLDAAAIAGMGGFESKAGAFVGGSMFGYAGPESYSITNLGKIECESMLSAMFIPPASPAAGCTLGVVTVNGKMRLCTSSYEKK